MKPMFAVPGALSVRPAAFGRLCVETMRFYSYVAGYGPAAFGRLCVETGSLKSHPDTRFDQPPSGGCVLKHRHSGVDIILITQPPSGGCVLKLVIVESMIRRRNQPPSGGCVLKQHGRYQPCTTIPPAAFGRLCVETFRRLTIPLTDSPAAFGRLCVETCQG